MASIPFIHFTFFRRPWFWALCVPFFIWLCLLLGAATPVVNFVISRSLPKDSKLIIRLGSLRTDLWSRIDIYDAEILSKKEDFVRPLATVDRLRLGFRLMDLWEEGNQPVDVIDKLVLSGFKVFVTREPDGEWNWGGLGGKKENAEDAPGLDQLFNQLAGRIALENGMVAFADETRKFYSTLRRINGNFDARALPLVSASLTARTDEQGHDNLSLSADWRVDKGTWLVRADLQRVPVERYFNYALPPEGIRFERGRGDLHLRLTGEGRQVNADGGARLRGAALHVPGLRQNLENINSELSFKKNSLDLTYITADFLGSNWTGSGTLDDFSDPSIDLVVNNPFLDMARVPQDIYGLTGLDLGGAAALSVTITGKVAGAIMRGRLTSDLIAIHGVPLENFSAGVRIQGNSFKLDEISARVAGGLLQAQGDFVFPGSARARRGFLQASGNLRSARLENVVVFEHPVLPFVGNADLELTLAGDFSAPVLKVEINSHDALLGKMPFGPMQVNVGLENGLLNIDASSQVQPLKAQAQVKLGKIAEFGSASLMIGGMSLADLSEGISMIPDGVKLPAFVRDLGNRCKGHCRGDIDLEIHLAGPVVDPTVQIESRLADIKILPSEDGPFQTHSVRKLFGKDRKWLTLRLVGPLGWSGGRLVFGDADRDARLGFNSEGYDSWINMNGEYAVSLAKTGLPPRPLEVSIFADIKNFNAFSVFKRNESHGPIQGKLTITGAEDKPRIEGKLAVIIKKLMMSKGIKKLEEGQLNLAFQGRRLVISDSWLKGGGLTDIEADLDFSDNWWPRGRVGIRSQEGRGIELLGLPMIDRMVLGFYPLEIIFNGPGSLVLARGKIRLDGTYLSMTDDMTKNGGQSKPLPLALDLKVALSDNVRFEKRVAGGLKSGKTVVGKILRSIESSVVEPSLLVQFRRTDKDLEVTGALPGIQVKGELSLIRGVLGLLGRDFSIQPGGRIDFKDGRANVYAQAATRVRQITGRPGEPPQNVEIVVKVKPYSEEKLVEYNLEKTLVNFADLSFESEPQKSRQAIYSLLVLGTDVSGDESSANDGTRDRALLQAATERGTNLAFRTVLSWFPEGWRKGSSKFFSNIADYFRVVPQFQYSSAKPDEQTSNSNFSSDDLRETLGLSDIMIDSGKSLTNKLFLRSQVMVFAETEKASSAIQDATLEQYSPYGLQAGLEYYVNPARMVELKYSVNVDQNLQASPEGAEDAWYVGVRNTVSKGAYSQAASTQRKWERTD